MRHRAVSVIRTGGPPETFAPQTAPTAADLHEDADRVNAAVIDIAHAVVRRYLLARQFIPKSADAIVDDCARKLIPSS
jgi:hypothetical protein